MRKLFTELEGIIHMILPDEIAEQIADYKSDIKTSLIEIDQDAADFCPPDALKQVHEIQLICAELSQIISRLS